MVVTVKVTATPGTVLTDRAAINAFNPDPDSDPGPVVDDEDDGNESRPAIWN